MAKTSHVSQDVAANGSDGDVQRHVCAEKHDERRAVQKNAQGRVAAGVEYVESNGRISDRNVRNIVRSPTALIIDRSEKRSLIGKYPPTRMLLAIDAKAAPTLRPEPGVDVNRLDEEDDQRRRRPR